MSDPKRADGSPFVSQTGKDRCVVEGRREDGDRCTLVIVRDGNGYVLYPHGGEKMQVRLGQGEAGTAGAFLMGGAA